MAKENHPVKKGETNEENTNKKLNKIENNSLICKNNYPSVYQFHFIGFDIKSFKFQLFNKFQKIDC